MFTLSPALGFALLFAATFMVLGVHLPFYPVWLEHRGLTDGAISVIVAAGFIGRIVAGPLIAHAAQYAHDPRRPILWLAAGAWAGFAVLFALDGFWSILIVGSLAVWFFSTLIPLSDVLAMQAQDAGRLDYGRMRALGSAAFIASSLCVGFVLDEAGAGGVLVALAICAGVLTLAAWTLPAPTGAPQTPAQEVAPWAQTLTLAGRPAFLLFLVAGGANQASHGVYYAFSAIHWSRIGYSDAVVGALWGVGVAAEVAFLAISGRFVARYGPAALLAAAGAAAALRWALTAMDPPLWALVPLQALHAVTFAATHAASVAFVVRAAPPSLAGAAMTLTASTGFGAATGLAALAAGGLYGAYAAGAYLPMAALGLVGCACGLLLQKRWNGDVIWRPEPRPAG